jgi:hypothetical protein
LGLVTGSARRTFPEADLALIAEFVKTYPEQGGIRLHSRDGLFFFNVLHFPGIFQKKYLNYSNINVAIVGNRRGR